MNAALATLRRRTFSLRTLLVLTVVSAVAFGLVRRRMLHLEASRQAVSQIGLEALWRSESVSENNRPRHLWAQAFDEVIELRDRSYLFADSAWFQEGEVGPTIGPAQLAQLDALSELEILVLQIPVGKFSRTKFLPLDLETFRRIGSLKRLHSLNLGWQPIDDAGLAEICRCESLVRLSIDPRNLTREGIEQLARLPKLESLRLEPTPGPQDFDFSRLRACPNLKRLYVSRESNTSEFAAHVQSHLPGATIRTDRDVKWHAWDELMAAGE